MYLTTTNFMPAPVVTNSTPIQRAGTVATTLMHHITMEQERILIGLQNAMDRVVDPMRPDALFCDQNDMTVFATLTERAKTLGSLLQSYFSGEELTVADVARKLPQFRGASAQDELFAEARAADEAAAFERGRSAEMKEAARARAGKGKSSKEA